MKRIALILVLLVASASSLAAQAASYPFTSGIKIRGDFHVNRSSVNGTSEIPQDENGYGLGLEINGRSLGVALYGYTAGQAQEFDSESTPVLVVAEANYFVPVEVLRIAAYAGVHTALGEFTKDYFQAPYLPKPQDGFNDLGYQVGIRFQPLSLIGIDAQWRRQSRFATEHQDPSLERTQVLVGLTLF